GRHLRDFDGRFDYLGRHLRDFDGRLDHLGRHLRDFDGRLDYLGRHLRDHGRGVLDERPHGQRRPCLPGNLPTARTDAKPTSTVGSVPLAASPSPGPRGPAREVERSCKRHSGGSSCYFASGRGSSVGPESTATSSRDASTCRAFSRAGTYFRPMCSAAKTFGTESTKRVPFGPFEDVSRALPNQLRTFPRVSPFTSNFSISDRVDGSLFANVLATSSSSLVTSSDRR